MTYGLAKGLHYLSVLLLIQRLSIPNLNNSLSIVTSCCILYFILCLFVKLFCLLICTYINMHLTSIF